MKHSARIIALMIAGLLTASALISCGTESEPESSSTTPDTPPQQTETTAETNPVEEALEKLRKTVDWGGKDFGVLYVNNITPSKDELEGQQSDGSSSGGSSLSEAVYQRNTLLEDYCNLTLALFPASNDDMLGRVMAEVQAGANDYQFINHNTAASATLATSGYLMDLLEMNIDYEQAWWGQDTLDFALLGKVFFMNTSANYTNDRSTFVFIFNKGLRETLGVANPYDTVKANKWTLDYFNSLISPLSQENGDGTWDEKDTYGFTTPDSIGNTFFYGAGLKYVNSSRDLDRPELMLTGSKYETALGVLEIARKIVHDNHSTYSANASQLEYAVNMFAEGRALFYSEIAGYVITLNQSMEAEYGILPVPKYTEKQEHYSTWYASVGTAVSVPTSAATLDMEQLAQVLETYVLLSDKLVRPAFYDNLLTTRSIRDAESAEMMDLIYSHRICDMAIFFADLKLDGVFAESVRGESEFASKYAALSKTFDTRLNKILRKLE